MLLLYFYFFGNSVNGVGAKKEPAGARRGLLQVEKSGILRVQIQGSPSENCRYLPIR